MHVPITTIKVNGTISLPSDSGRFPQNPPSS